MIEGAATSLAVSKVIKIMQKVKFKKEFGKYKEGKTYEVSNNDAASYIQRGVACLVTTPLPSPTRKRARRNKMMVPKRSGGYKKPKRRYSVR